MNYLVKTDGYFGDIFFATSIAERLKKFNSFCAVDFLVGFPQTVPIISRDENIRTVYTNGVGPAPILDAATFANHAVLHLGTLSLREPPMVELQRQAGIQDTRASFRLYADPEKTTKYSKAFRAVAGNRTVVAVGRDWQKKAFVYTNEEYVRGVNVPNLGYGGRLRNIDAIIRHLTEHFYIVEVGAVHSTQFDIVPRGDDLSLDEYVAMINACDYFVGTEGGLANIAYGLGIPTILTAEFVHQLYGENGVIRKVHNPQLGPVFYEPNSRIPHRQLQLYQSDDTIAQHIIDLILADELYTI
jgi:hypothetical protein